MKHNEPLVSIIIAFYNEEEYLERCLESVKNQTYKNLEVILINDGSTDNSLKIVEKFHKEFHCCKIITIENSGPGNARNVGIENVTGKYISFLDADDELEISALERMIDALENSNSDLVMCLNTMFDSSSNILKKSTWSLDEIIDSKIAISLLVNEKLIPTVWGKLFKTSIAKKIRFLNSFWKEDDVFVLNYLDNSQKIFIIKEHLIKINCRNNSLTRQVISAKMIKDICVSYDCQFEILNSQLNKKDLYQSKINTFLNLFLIIAIDLNKIKNKEEVLSIYFEKLKQLQIHSKQYSISFKKKLVLFYLINSRIIGLGNSFKTIQILKTKTYYSLLNIKS